MDTHFFRKDIQKMCASITSISKNGFIEMPVDKEKFPSERADIAFGKYVN